MDIEPALRPPHYYGNLLNRIVFLAWCFSPLLRPNIARKTSESLTKGGLNSEVPQCMTLDGFSLDPSAYGISF